MKKASYLQSSLLLSKLQARLQKNPYLSRGSLPSWEDARVFLAIEQLKKTPNKQTHSYLYHWYVIMRQFARRTMEAWAAGTGDEEQDDQLISQFLQEANSLLINGLTKNQRDQPNPPQIRKIFQEKFNQSRNVVTSPKNIKRRISQNYVEFNQNINLSQKEIANSPINISPIYHKKRVSFNLLSKKNDKYFVVQDLEYVMEIQLTAQQSKSSNALKERIAKEGLNLLSFEGRDGASVQIVFRIEAEACEALKDRISQWPEVSNIRFRREKRTACLKQINSQKNIFSPLRKIPKISS